jgi:uncharacterized membrane protein
MTTADKENRLEAIISVLLIVGVILSVLFEVIGIILYFGAYGNVAVSESSNVMVVGENFFAFTYRTLQNLFVSENSLLFLTLGIIILILTPYIRAITSFVYFAWEKNRPYVIITLFVIVVLTLSLALH